MTTVFGDRWQLPLLVASGLSLIGGVLVLVAARDGPYLSPSRRFDPMRFAACLASAVPPRDRRLSRACGSR